MPLDGVADSTAIGFDDILPAHLEALPVLALDALPYGVIGLDADGTVSVYNATEAKLARISASAAIGVHFFSELGQCMNNFMVAQRFEDEAEIDDQLDYVLTLRMRPTRVRLRLLKAPSAALHYILIRR